VLDCNYLGHQARYSLRDLSHEEIPTGVIFGFLSRVISLGNLFKTNEILFCWDSKHSHRKKIFPGYKSKRGKDRTPAEQREFQSAMDQFKELRLRILPRIGFRNVFVQAGIEADDLIAKICMSGLSDFIVISADHDLYQLLYPNVRIFNPSSKKMMTHSRFRDEYGLDPAHWSRVKAIGGCTSDSIPGVQGVGEKGAVDYLRGKLKPGKKRDKILSSQDLIDATERLTKLPFLKTKEIVVRRDSFDLVALDSICSELGFESLDLGAWEHFFRSEFEEPKERTVKVRRRM